MGKKNTRKINTYTKDQRERISEAIFEGKMKLQEAADYTGFPRATISGWIKERISDFSKSTNLSPEEIAEIIGVRKDVVRIWLGQDREKELLEMKRSSQEALSKLGLSHDVSLGRILRHLNEIGIRLDKLSKKIDSISDGPQDKAGVFDAGSAENDSDKSDNGKSWWAGN